MAKRSQGITGKEVASGRGCKNTRKSGRDKGRQETIYYG